MLRRFGEFLLWVLAINVASFVIAIGGHYFLGYQYAASFPDLATRVLWGFEVVAAVLLAAASPFILLFLFLTGSIGAGVQLGMRAHSREERRREPFRMS